MNETMKESLTVNEPVETASEKPYSFKKLTAEHIFPMINIINKIGIKEFKAAFESEEIRKSIGVFINRKPDEKAVEDGEKAVEDAINQIGVTVLLEAAQIVLSNIPKCENEIFKFLSSVSTLDEKMVRNLGIAEFAEMVFDFFKKEELGDFFKVVSKLFK